MPTPLPTPQQDRPILFNMRLTAGQRDRLRYVAEARGMSMSALVRESIEAAAGVRLSA